MVVDPSQLFALLVGLYGVGFALGLVVQVLHLGRR